MSSAARVRRSPLGLASARAVFGFPAPEGHSGRLAGLAVPVGQAGTTGFDSRGRGLFDSLARGRDDRGMNPPDLEIVSTDALIDELVRRFPSLVFAGASEAFAGQDPDVVRHLTRRSGYLIVQAGMLRMLTLRVEEQILEDARRGCV